MIVEIYKSSEQQQIEFLPEFAQRALAARQSGPSSLFRRLGAPFPTLPAMLCHLVVSRSMAHLNTMQCHIWW